MVIFLGEEGFVSVFILQQISATALQFRNYNSSWLTAPYTETLAITIQRLRLKFKINILFSSSKLKIFSCLIIHVTLWA